MPPPPLAIGGHQLKTQFGVNRFQCGSRREAGYMIIRAPVRHQFVLIADFRTTHPHQDRAARVSEAADRPSAPSLRNRPRWHSRASWLENLRCRSWLVSCDSAVARTVVTLGRDVQVSETKESITNHRSGNTKQDVTGSG